MSAPQAGQQFTGSRRERVPQGDSPTPLTGRARLVELLGQAATSSCGSPAPDGGVTPQGVMLPIFERCTLQESRTRHKRSELNRKLMATRDPPRDCPTIRGRSDGLIESNKD